MISITYLFFIFIYFLIILYIQNFTQNSLLNANTIVLKFQIIIIHYPIRELMGQFHHVYLVDFLHFLVAYSNSFLFIHKCVHNDGFSSAREHIYELWL